jgi:hypothetical protein
MPRQNTGVSLIRMQSILLRDLVHLQSRPANQAAFVISRDKSTFIHAGETEWCAEDDSFFWAIPTPLCGESSHQYNPRFVMAVLSNISIQTKLEITELNALQLPKVLFTTHPDIRRSMTLNSMRMSLELLETGSERVFTLAQNRLRENQTDIIHDLLVYLMHAILDARRELAQEKMLRAESMAAYMGISPAKVLLLLTRYENNSAALTKALEQNEAGTLQRKLDTHALVDNQLELLLPYRNSAQEKEEMLRKAIREIIELWQRR